jgi:signal transduction histidine kinase
VLGDMESILSAVSRIIANAVEAHEKEGRVTATTVEEGGTAVVRILDEGVGLSPFIASRIFQPFFTTKPNGAGLGLAMANEVIKAHGGRIWARSRTDRQGAEFVIELQRATSGGP